MMLTVTMMSCHGVVYAMQMLFSDAKDVTMIFIVGDATGKAVITLALTQRTYYLELFSIEI